MPFVDKFREAVIGKPHDPLHPDTRHNIALVAFLAWIGTVRGRGYRFTAEAR